MRQDLTDLAVTEYVRARLRQDPVLAKRGEKTKLARRLGCSPAHITNLTKGVVGAGPSLVRAIAAEWGMSVPELETEALKATPKRDRYPNRLEALRLAAEMPWKREAYKEVLDLTPAGDPPIVWWILTIYRAVEQHAAFAHVTSSTPAARKRA